MKFYDREGRVITLDEWVALVERLEYKRVASTMLGHYWVSTVWLGVDHGMGLNPLPVIFETMVFNHSDETNALDDELCDRYTTEAAALAGHETIVRLVELSVEQHHG